MRKINLLPFFGKWPGTKKELKSIKTRLDLDRRKFKTRVLESSFGSFRLKRKVDVIKTVEESIVELKKE